MIRREPVALSVFTDRQAAERYDTEIRSWLLRVSRRLISTVRSWEAANGNVLDVGTGTGILAFAFAQAFPDAAVTGLDLSSVALEIAQDKARQYGLAGQVRFEQGDAEKMPFEDDTFSLVISSNTLHLVSDPVRMFDEIQRVLTPEGRFYLTDFRRNWLGLVFEPIRASYVPGEVAEMLRRSTLQDWRVKGFPFELDVLSGETQMRAP
jgi:ubiquinone/menaquinone biosynthesis C-methylase UbiE